MSNPIVIIVRREVRETLSDWRIVTPILLLTFLLPQMLVFASVQVVLFVADDALAARLVPFAALLVGFVPASFSLITALESFVGERERNSLESLLAMPLSDRELYTGKLLSALFTPLGSSMVAMAIFTGLLLGFAPRLYTGAITVERLLLLVVLVAAMAVVMVAGAVVISSHITTVRAANLMSSFILLPMAAVMQLAAFLIINGRWAELAAVAAALLALGVLLVRAGMRSFSREELLSREHAQGRIAFGLRLPRLPARRPRMAAAPGERRRAPAAVIARRELAEVLSDWRMLVPLTTITVGLPLALIAGISLALGFVRDAEVLGRLVPFMALLVGFVPASFSLITALESFVGERERNSLESLLAMPLSDRELYTGKLVSSLLVPLAGSLLGMTIFLAGMRVFHPGLYADGMSAARILQVTLMISVVTVLLVAGAVVISSHTSSVRAATLMASGVLMPTTAALQLQALLFIARRYDLLWLALAALLVIAVALLRCGLTSFNREEILSREHEELSLGRLRRSFATCFKEFRPAGTPLAAYTGLPFSPRRFYRRELPALLRELRLPAACALVAVVGGLLFGGYIGQRYHLSAFDAALAQLGTPPAPRPGLALAIFANNLRVSILSNLLAPVSFGIFPFLVPAVAFGQIGFVASTLADSGGWAGLGPGSPLLFLLAYVLPHGIVELPTFVLSAAIGLRIGAALLAPPPGFTVGQNLLWSLANFAKLWLLVLLPLVALGSAIEGLLTPLVIAALY